MSKYDNFVYMTICEVTLVSYKDTGFSTHSNYCRDVAFNIKANTLSNKQKSHIALILKTLDKIYSMNPEDVGIYVANYFLEEKFLTLETVVRMTNEYFPNIQKFTDIKV
jgi:hypothetical protein